MTIVRSVRFATIGVGMSTIAAMHRMSVLSVSRRPTMAAPEMSVSPDPTATSWMPDLTADVRDVRPVPIRDVWSGSRGVDRYRAKMS